MALGQRSGDSQQPTERMPTATDNRGEHQHQKAWPDRSTECIGPYTKGGTHSRRYVGDQRLLARTDSGLVNASNLPTRKLLVLYQFPNRQQRTDGQRRTERRSIILTTRARLTDTFVGEGLLE